MPARIRLRRTRGWRLPEDAVTVARPSRWGNPYRIGDHGVPDRATAVARFTELMAARRTGTAPPDAPRYPSDADIRAELAGRDLACWCPLDGPCHADVLLAIANPRPATDPQ